MDILERVFLSTAATGVVILVAMTSLLAAGPDPMPASVLQALRVFDPVAALTGDPARANHHRAAER